MLVHCSSCCRAATYGEPSPLPPATQSRFDAAANQQYLPEGGQELAKPSAFSVEGQVNRQVPDSAESGLSVGPRVDPQVTEILDAQPPVNNAFQPAGSTGSTAVALPEALPVVVIDKVVSEVPQGCSAGNGADSQPAKKQSMFSANNSRRNSLGSQAGEVACWEYVDDLLNNSVMWSSFVCVLTIWALFIDDLKVLVMPKSVDSPIFIINLVVLGIFILEFICCWLCTPNYKFTLGSLMDFFAAASLIPFEEILTQIGGVGESLSVARVARAARALRILRSMRAAAMALKTEARIRQVRKILNKKDDSSVLADTLLKSTNTKMLLGILTLLMGTTLLDYQESNRVAEGGLVLLDETFGDHYLPAPLSMHAKEEQLSWERMWHNYRTGIEGDDGETLLELKVLHVWGTTMLLKPTDSLRKTDINTYFAGNDTMRARSFSVVSKEAMNKQIALNSMIMTAFSVFVIIIWAWSFRRDHINLVIKPCNRMIAHLKEMSMDPRKAVERSREAGALEDGQTEMEVIEYCIGRFGGLLKVGFGEAGMEIIARNLASDSFDPVVPGTVVQAVFGFCDIRNFTDCCEVLKTDTMVFTNAVAHIVHHLVEASGGAVNKNIGDAFLSVWKLQETTEDEPQTPMTTGSSTRKKTFAHHITGGKDICDGTLRAFLKLHEQMKTAPSIQKIASDHRLQTKMPGFTVQMGAGLHRGWAIEGAVGSAYKVDATYLSPHVNMSSRLEAATKQYGVKTLISEALVDVFNDGLRSECRPVDRVTVKGSDVPLILYVHMPSESPELQAEQRSSFMKLWTEAFGLYQQGVNWDCAKVLMTQCLEIFPTDCPAKVLMRVIEEAGGKAPPDWPGYRALTNK